MKIDTEVLKEVRRTSIEAHRLDELVKALTVWSHLRYAVATSPRALASWRGIPGTALTEEMGV